MVCVCGGCLDMAHRFEVGGNGGDEGKVTFSVGRGDLVGYLWASNRLEISMDRGPGPLPSDASSPFAETLSVPKLLFPPGQPQVFRVGKAPDPGVVGDVIPRLPPLAGVAYLSRLRDAIFQVRTGHC